VLNAAFLIQAPGPTTIDWGKVLEIVGLLGAAGAAIRLRVEGLHSKYRVLFSYLIFRVLYCAIPLLLNPASQIYEKLFICTQPVTWMFYILMVRELYSLTLAAHRGLQTLGRWAMYVAVTISVTVSMLSILKRITPRTPQLSRILGYVFAIDRGVNFALVIFILLILLFLSRYPVTLSRNVVRHSTFLFVFFLSNATLVLLRTIYGRPASPQISLILAGIGTLAVLAWLFLLTPGGEETRRVVSIAPEHEEHILRQLDSLNATLLKISRN